MDPNVIPISQTLAEFCVTALMEAADNLEKTRDVASICTRARLAYRETAHSGFIP